MLLSACLFLASCHSDKSGIPTDRTDAPNQEVRDARVKRSEHGKLQLELDSPLIQKYEKPVPKTIYKGDKDHRIQLRFYNDEHKIKSLIEANYAISFDDRNIMEARDSVVVIDFSNGDTVYLEDLIWNSEEDRVYSDNPVKAKNGNRLTQGDGFSSDPNMENMRIIHQRGVIEFED